MEKIIENKQLIERLLNENKEDLELLDKGNSLYKIISKRTSDRVEVIMLLIEENIQIRTLKFNDIKNEQ